jgi:hypothetical protein
MDDSSDSDQEGLEKVLSDLKGQMASIETASHELTLHISDLFQRAKVETVDWMNEPLKPRGFVKEWCTEHGLPATPTLNEFIDACFTAASFLDLETRVITFKKEDAEILWKGKRRISIFELISCIPTLFY